VTSYLPKYFISKAIALYFIVLAICSARFSNTILPLHWIFFGAIEVISFFYFSNLLSKRWGSKSPHLFKKKLFKTALIIRIVYVLFSFFFYTWMTGEPFEFSGADSRGYDGEARWLMALFESNQLDIYKDYIKNSYSDMGYVVYLASLYTFFGKSILFVRLIKAILSAYMCVLVYKIAERNFGEPTAKIAGIAAMLFPNLIYYCGLHLKETEMVFLTVLFLERADFVLKNKKINYTSLIFALILCISLFFFRTVLGVTTIFSIGVGFLFLSIRKYGLARKIAFVFLLVLFAIFLRGGVLESEVSKYWGDRDSNQQSSMQARSKADTGNKLAKYGTTAVFAPAILFVPFPTLVDIPIQQNQMFINGAYFVKNIYAFFVLIGLIFIYKLKKIRTHALILSFLFGYLAVIAMSKFAISERFHLPVLPVFIIIGAYGITQLNQKNKKYYIPYLGVIALLIIGWNIFKIAGRG
jgi:hypothetical protein